MASSSRDPLADLASFSGQCSLEDAPVIVKRRVEMSSRLFGGFHTYISLEDFHCTCEIEEHVKALLCAHLIELNLNRLAEILMESEFDIHQEFDDIQKNDHTIWVCDGCQMEI